MPLNMEQIIMKNCLIAETTGGKIEIDFNALNNYPEVVTLIAAIAENPRAEVKYTYFESGINGGRDTEADYTARGHDAILYLSEFFNSDSFADAVQDAAELTKTYDAENWLKSTEFYPV